MQVTAAEEVAATLYDSINKGRYRTAPFSELPDSPWKSSAIARGAVVLSRLPELHTGEDVIRLLDELNGNAKGSRHGDLWYRVRTRDYNEAIERLRHLREGMCK